MNEIKNVEDLKKINTTNPVSFTYFYENMGEIKANNTEGLLFGGYFISNGKTYFIASSVKSAKYNHLTCNFVSSGLYSFEYGKVIEENNAVTGFSKKSELEQALNRHLEILKLGKENKK
jgi:hypothetical protein